MKQKNIVYIQVGIIAMDHHNKIKSQKTSQLYSSQSLLKHNYCRFFLYLRITEFGTNSTKTDCMCINCILRSCTEYEYAYDRPEGITPV